MEQSWFTRREPESPREQVEFWLRELRSPELLMEAAAYWAEAARSLASSRPAIAYALAEDLAAVEQALAREELEERRLDREYWRPIRRELEQIRMARERE